MRAHEWLKASFATAIFLVVFNAQSGLAINNLRVAYKWKQLDYNWPDNQTRQLFSHYVRENNVPVAIEITGDRLFITLPRWRPGVAATLNYIYLNDTSKSPLLNPYPSWEAHRSGEDHVPEVVSTFHIKADRCGRLWVLDNGREGLLVGGKLKAPPSLIVYDLSNDQVLRKYVIPGLSNPAATLFAYVAVEDAFCNDTFAYFSDAGDANLVVYSWLRNESWVVRHHYFHPDPMGGNFNVSGLSFQWWYALVELTLVPKPDGYSTLYFSSLSSEMFFSVDTKILRDRELASQSLGSTFHEFKVLGSGGHYSQSASGVLDPTTGIIFQAATVGNRIFCWRPETEYNIDNIGHVYTDNVTLIAPVSIKIDFRGNIWTLSDRAPHFMYSNLDPNEYNFHVLTGSAEEAARGTVCERSSSPPS